MSEFKAHPVKAFSRVWVYLLIFANPVQRRQTEAGLGSHNTELEIQYKYKYKHKYTCKDKYKCKRSEQGRGLVPTIQSWKAQLT